MREGTIRLLLRGAKVTGSFVEGFHYVCEDLYTDEVEDACGFCEWIDKEIGGAGKANINMLYRAYKNPDNKSLQKIAQETKERISRLRSLT